MIFGQAYKAQCRKCKAIGDEKKGFSLPGVIFPFLEDEPFICERCIFEAFTGTKTNWREEILKYIQEEAGSE